LRRASDDQQVGGLDRGRVRSVNRADLDLLAGCPQALGDRLGHGAGVAGDRLEDPSAGIADGLCTNRRPIVVKRTV
jgi:hypothetical protein